MDEITKIAKKCMTQAKNQLYFSYKALAPAIFRMPIKWHDTSLPQLSFGTDGQVVYANAGQVINCYRQGQEFLIRTYLHTLFHCIYLHPWLPEQEDMQYWSLAMDICCEAAIQRLDKKFPLSGDAERESVIKKIRPNVKLFIPSLVYKELMKNDYDIDTLIPLFYKDAHLWLLQSDASSQGQGQNNNQKNQKKQGGGPGLGQNQNQNQDQNQGNGNGQGNNQNQDQGQGNGNGQGRGNSQDNNQDDGQGGGSGQDQSQGPNQSHEQGQSNSQSQQSRQEWSDVARRVATDMAAFHKQQGTDAGDLIDEIDYLTKDKMDYEDFLRQFSITEERMKINLDEFDYSYYMYGLMGLPDANGKKTIDKQALLIEPLEYKEDKAIKDFVIAIDTSGSCAGELVKKFIRKTYSILKEQESFSSRVNIHIIQCDTVIQHDTKITNQDEMELFMNHMKLYGFGGTDFRPVFQYVEKLQKEHEFEHLCGLIYFTDGYGTYPTTPTEYKTAFAFLEDYTTKDVPPWAMSVIWDSEE